ncbi:hypothetical protein D3C72_2089710 [compost metagenome]
MVGMFPCEGKHLRVGSRSKATEKYADKQQDKIVAVPGEKYASEHAQQTAKNNQTFAVTFSVRAACQELADQDADNGASGKKEADHSRTGMDFISQK